MAEAKITEFPPRGRLHLSLPPRSLDEAADLSIHADHSLDALVLALDDHGVELILSVPATVDLMLRLVGALGRLQDGNLQ
jgi:hypothetical protein